MEETKSDPDQQSDGQRQAGGTGDHDQSRTNCCEKACDAIKRIWSVIAKWVTAAANPIMALATIAIAILTYSTLLNTRDIFKQSERAWIVPGTMKLKLPLETGQYNEVVLNYRNPGKQPAIRVTAKYETLAVANADFAQPPILQARILIAMKGIECRARKPSADGLTVFPSGEGQDAVRIEITADTATKVKDKNSYLVVAACYAYETFGITHHAEFCRFFDHGVLKENATSLDWGPSKCFIPDYAD